MQATLPKGASGAATTSNAGRALARDEEQMSLTADIKPHPPTPTEGKTLRDRFRTFSNCTSTAVGSPAAFIIAVLLIAVWGITGPMFHYSDTWQLVINTSTTIVTFLMVFLIQNTQNRDARAIHLKLDELIRGTKGPRNQMVMLEQASDEELEEVEGQFRALKERRAQRQREKHAH